jgi:thymidylate kinase
VREIFIGDKQIQNQRAMVYLMTADAICCMDALRAASRDGVAIADRYSLSSGWVYQTSEGWGIDDLYDIVKPELFVIPDMTFIVDVPSEVAMQRIESRAAAAAGAIAKNSMYEERLERKRGKYLAYARMEPFGPCHLVDGRGTRDEILNEMISKLVEAGLWVA